MEDRERKLLEEMWKIILDDLKGSIEKAREDNEDIRKKQAFIIEKITVDIMLGKRLPSADWVNEGIKHYIDLGTMISRNDALTRLAEEATKLQMMKDPKKIEKVIENYRKHEKEVMASFPKKSVILQARFKP